MLFPSFFRFAAFATLSAVVDVSHAAPQAPGYFNFGGPAMNMGRPGGPPNNSPKSSGSTVCFTSSKSPAIRGRPTTTYTTLTTCTTTSTLVVTTTVSPLPAVTTSTVVTTSTTTGATVTDTAITTTVTTTTQMTTLPVETVSTTSIVSTATTVTQTTGTFRNVADTLPTATFSKKKRQANRPGFSPNDRWQLGQLPSPFSGDVSCIIYQSQCASVIQTITSTATLSSTTITSMETSTVVVTSIPIANTTITMTSTDTTTSTITPAPTTTIMTSTVTTTVTATVSVNPCPQSNMISGINGGGINGIQWIAGEYSSTSASSSSDCCLAANGNPSAAQWAYYSGSCFVITNSKCSADQSLLGGILYRSNSLGAGKGFFVGNTGCGGFNAWK